MTIHVIEQAMTFDQAMFYAHQGYNGRLAKPLNIDDKKTIMDILRGNDIGPGVEVWVGYCSPTEEDSRVGNTFKDGDPNNTSPVLVRIDKNTDSTVRARVNVDPNERHPLLVETS